MPSKRIRFASTTTVHSSRTDIQREKVDYRRTKGAPSRRTAYPADHMRLAVCRSDHRLQPLYDAGFDEDARLVVRDRNVEYLCEHRAPQMDQPARPVRLLGLYATGLRAAALRIAFDQCDKACVGQLLMLGAQSPASDRLVLHAGTQATV